ncbi:unknown [Tannerella sp. CAG:118]|nr:unknown [Tannerella sp. CAG:118]
MDWGETLYIRAIEYNVSPEEMVCLNSLSAIFVLGKLTPFMGINNSCPLFNPSLALGLYLIISSLVTLNFLQTE